MPKIILIKYPLNQEFICEKGSRLTDILLENNIILSTFCAGRGTCKKCLVKVIEGNVAEEAKYGDFYLACQVKVNNDLVIEIPEAKSAKYEFKNKFNFIEKNIDEKSKKFEIINIKLEKPSKEDKMPDLERILSAIPKDYSLKKLA